MKQIDRDGLLECSLQGDLFAMSAERTECSSVIFIRRFFNSEISEEFDSLAILDGTLSVFDMLENIEDEFGKSNYGKVKYNKEVLFWIGYIYRYFCYTYNIPSKTAYKIIKPKELNEAYYVYHTFDPSVAIERLLEEKGISFDLDKLNERLLQMLRKREYKANVSVKEMTNALFKEFLDGYEGENRINSFKKQRAGHILLAIIYKNETVGMISLSDDVHHDLKIYLKEKRFEGKGLGTVAVLKSTKLIKNNYGIKSLRAEIPNDESDVSFFKNLGFIYQSQDAEHSYYVKRF